MSAIQALRAFAIGAFLWLAAPEDGRAQPRTPELSPRAFAVVRLGPIGHTTVRAPTRELSGVPIAAPGIGVRLDVPAAPHLLVGFDAGMLFEGENDLRPYHPQHTYELGVNGLVLDAVLSARPFWRLSGIIELYATGGVGLSLRPSMSGTVPLTDAEGATPIDGTTPSFDAEPAWGVLAQGGVGATFWLQARVGVFFELTALTRQTVAVANNRAYGDFTLLMRETQGLVLVGVGGALGGTW